MSTICHIDAWPFRHAATPSIGGFRSPQIAIWSQSAGHRDLWMAASRLHNGGERPTIGFAKPINGAGSRELQRGISPTRGSPH
jgi:hypothetical protein